MEVLDKSPAGTHECGSCGAHGCSAKAQSLAREFEAILRQARSADFRADAETPEAQRPTTHYLNSGACLPIVNELSYRCIGGRHLWIGIQDGICVVFDDADHAIFERLRRGQTPDAVAADLASDQRGDLAWDAVSKVIGRLATSGFIDGIEGYHEIKLPEPERFARFHLTKACQLECIHCYADSSPFVPRDGELPLERWTKVIDEFAKYRGERVLFTGGEALLHPGCIPLMRQAHELGLEVTLFTNGIWVPRFIDGIAAAADIVQVSLDGPDAATNDPIRGRGTYRRIMQAIDLLVSHGTRVRIGISVMRQNWEAWKSGFADLAARYRGAAIEFRMSYGVTHYGRAEGFPDDIGAAETAPVVQRLLEDAVGVAQRPQVTRRTSGCGYFEQFVVGPTGHVFPCHLLDHPIGHVDDQPVADFVRQMRQMAGYIDVDHVEGCNTCDIRYLCGGTCRVINGGRTGTRLVTTCRPEDRQRKYENLASMYWRQ